MKRVIPISLLLLLGYHSLIADSLYVSHHRLICPTVPGTPSGDENGKEKKEKPAANSTPECEPDVCETDCDEKPTPAIPLVKPAVSVKAKPVKSSAPSASSETEAFDKSSLLMIPFLIEVDEPLL